ncbi:NAC domain-containing protein 83 [Artemisia annua]|uniref:NAC domain-containing protein 83 n=1 Tax=Artemisia annua TaxID=35608 RepID=A0A2U1NC46_ARTAN|nr:NAC domain-containing protein 83 [Artemisia annua]
MAVRPLPFTGVYAPTNTDLILILTQKLQNKPIPFDQVIHLDLYSNHPSTLLHNTQPAIKQTQEHVIYTPREINRLVLGGKVGIWKQVSDFGYVVKIDGNDGNVIGREMRFVFYEGDVVDVGVVRKTDWCMTEFITLNEDEGGFAICKVGEDAAWAEFVERSV